MNSFHPRGAKQTRTMIMPVFSSSVISLIRRQIRFSNTLSINFSSFLLFFLFFCFFLFSVGSGFLLPPLNTSALVSSGILSATSPADSFSDLQNQPMRWVTQRFSIFTPFRGFLYETVTHRRWLPDRYASFRKLSRSCVRTE